MNLNAGLGADTIIIASTLGDTTKIKGNGGADTINVQTTALGSVTTVNGDDGDDIFNVGNVSNSLDGILGVLTINGNASSVSDTLNINDQGDVNDNIYTLNGTTLDRTGMAQLTYGTIEALNLNAGLGADTIIIASTHGDTTTINANGGADTINVQTTATGSVTTVNGDGDDDVVNVGNTGNSLDDILGILTVNGNDPAASDTLNINDQSDPDDNAYLLTGTTLDRTGMAQLTYDTFENLFLNTGTGSDDIILSNTHTGVTTVNANDGADTVIVQTTNGETIVNGQNGNDQVIVQTTGAGQTTTINGNEDDDIITVQTTGGPTTVNGQGGDDQITVQGSGDGQTTMLNGDIGNDRFTIQMTGGPTTANGHAGNDQIIILGTGAGQITTVNADEGRDTFTVSATGLGSTTTLNGGADADTFNVQTIAGDTTINAGTGDDTVNVSSDAPTNLGTLNGIAAHLVVNGDGDAGADILNISDAGDPGDNTGDLTKTQMTGFGMSVGLTYGSFEVLNITLGLGNDLISVHSTHTPNITTVDAGPGDDTYLIYPDWGAVFVTERAGNGVDTMDFTPVSSNLIFLIGGGVQVSAGANLLEHPCNCIEHLIGGSGSDWFVMSRPGAQLAGGTGTITGGDGYDTISYEHYAEYASWRIYNGIGLAKPADVENVVMPPEKPATDDVLLDLLGYYGGNKTIDELIDLVKGDVGTYRSGSGTSLPLNIGLPTAILTPADNLVVFSGGIGGVATVEDIPGSSLATFDLIRPGMTYLGQNRRMGTFSGDAALVGGVTVSVSNGDGALGMLPTGESMAVIFQIPAYMLGRDVAIMWWDEARGVWREIDATVTPDGRIIGITNLTGTFVLVARD